MRVDMRLDVSGLAQREKGSLERRCFGQSDDVDAGGSGLMDAWLGLGREQHPPHCRSQPFSLYYPRSRVSRSSTCPLHRLPGKSPLFPFFDTSYNPWLGERAWGEERALEKLRGGGGRT